MATPAAPNGAGTWSGNGGSGVVVVGAGHAGVETAAALRDAGYDGRVTLVGEEPCAPYERPPLSKDFLAGTIERAGLALRAPSFYTSRDIDLLTGRRVSAVEPREHRVRLADGGTLGYRHLVLATGARNRPLPVPGTALDGVYSLRTAAEAAELRDRLGTSRDVVLVGGGFIGLELAAVTASGDRRVTVVESAPRCLGRVASRALSAHVESVHRARGVTVLTGTGVTGVIGAHGTVIGVTLTDGRTLPADLVVVGIGATADTAPLDGVVPHARAAAPATGGVPVDRRCRTAVPDVFAAGDCAAGPGPDQTPLRLESVPNAADHARRVAAAITGQRYAPPPPWFWSHQGGLRVQIAGIAAGHDRTVLRGDPTSGRFSVFCFRGPDLLAVESVNRPAHHMTAKRLLAAGVHLSPEEAADQDLDLTELARPAPT